MKELADQQLLCAYAEQRAEPAYAELVRRHIDLVYSAALRMVCDAHLAEDVTQAVFVALAQNARQLTDRPVLSGWLHRTAQNLAAKTVRSESRRHAREQEAATMNELLAAEPKAIWEHIAPHLDTALGELNEQDRDALLLRYFERKSAREMAQSLGISDEAAQKRVSRAVERLREYFAKHGISAGASGLAVVISANAVQAAPAGLAITISSATTVAGTTIVATATAAKVIAMTTLQKTIIGATLAAAIGTGIFEARQNSELREHVQTLQQQQEDLTAQIQQMRRDQMDTKAQVATLRDTPSPAVRSNALSVSAVNIRSNTIPSLLLESEIERAFAEPTPGRREAALKRIGDSIAPADLPRAMTFLAQRPGTNGVQSPLFNNLAKQWGEKNPNPAVDWASSLSDASTRKLALVNIVKGWVQLDPEAAASYAATLPPGDLQDDAVLGIVHEWSFLDPASAVNWVSQFPKGKLRDQAVEPLFFWGNGRCPAALAEMLDTFGDPELFKQRAEQVARTWLRMDEPAARAWIEKSSLPDEIKQQLFKPEH